MNDREKEFREWFEIWSKDKKREINDLNHCKARVVVLKDEINKFLDDKEYCNILEKRIKSLLEKIEILEKKEKDPNKIAKDYSKFEYKGILPLLEHTLIGNICGANDGYFKPDDPRILKILEKARKKVRKKMLEEGKNGR